jgi:type IV pilus assembly protein PilC
MAQFSYQGVDRAGKKVAGAEDVGTEGELRMRLRSLGIRPTRIAKANAMNSDIGAMLKGSGFKTGLSLPQLLSFTRQLQVLISAGVPVVQSLEILEEQSLDRTVKKLFETIKDKVSSGSFLWQAMAQYPRAFPKMYVALVRAGESSGSMDQMLSRLGRYLENIEKLRRMIKSAMIYPVMVVSIGAGVIGVMLVFVIPKFEEILKGNNQEMPGPTQFVITLSHFMIDHIMVILGTGVTTGVLLARFLKTDEGKAVLDQILFKAPLFGSLMQRAGTARFTRTLGTLLQSGVNLLDALDICKATIDNTVLEVAVGKIRTEVEAGKTLGAVIARLNVFPRMAIQMISVGEATGSLDKMLEKVADFYEEEVELAVGAMSKLIEPIMLVFLGGTVGGMMIAMYLPIFKMAGASG